MADATSAALGPGYRRRFLAAYVVLAVLAVGLAAGGAYFAFIRSSGGPKAFTQWRPFGEAVLRPAKVARHVAKRYQLEPGKPIVKVYDQAPVVQNVPISAIAVIRNGEPTTFKPLPTEKNTVVYILCGKGPKCEIGSGPRTAKENALLRRESLELALLTLKYVPTITGVLVTMPYDLDKVARQGLYLRRADAEDELLKDPLEKTMGNLQPPRADALTGDDLERIDKLTLPHFFKLAYYRLEDNTLALGMVPVKSP